MTKRGAGSDPVDIHVGKMIRARRLAIGVSQSQLAQALELTFQQIQKYERGVNRVSASKLFEIGKALDVPLSAFFDGLDPATEGPVAQPELASFLVLDDARSLARAYLKLSTLQRRRLVQLAEVIAPGGE